MGDGLAPLFALLVPLALGAAIGEVSAVVALVRGERWGWLSGFGVAVNAGVLIWVGLLVTGGWK